MSLFRKMANPAYKPYEAELEKEVRAGGIPEHVAIIMDGNRRYAREVMGEEASQGHVKGKDKFEEVTRWCLDLGVKYLTVYAFSVENFSRSQEEVDMLMDLISSALIELADSEEVQRYRPRIRVIGDRSIIPENLYKAVEYAENKTKDYDGCCLSIAIAYGGRQEIVGAVREISRKVKEGEIDIDDINEEMLSDHLSTREIPDPDLVLRTSGEVRVSNFLLWQIAYSELYFTDVYWPGFRRIDLLRAIRTYQQRKRRYGA
jgi:tritrans,polycis-undecaprenyl-diphosphate synthase [geranylgeranyl-diphosphate specific]